MVRKEKKRKGFFALSQITLLVVSIISISYILGSGLPVVEAQAGELCVKGTDVRIGSITDSNGNQDIWCRDTPLAQINGLCEGGSGVRKVKAEFKVTCPGSASDTETPSLFPGPVGGAVANRAADRVLRNTGNAEAETGLSASDQEIINKAADGDADLTPQELARLKEINDAASSAPGPLSTGAFVSAKNAVGRIVGNFLVAAALYGGIKWVGNLLKIDPELADSVAKAVAAGYLTQTVAIPAANTGITALGGSAIGGPVALGVTALVALTVFAFSYEQTKLDLYSFSCLPWDAPIGGANCEECNNQEIPCTEYRCRALGQQCEIVNKGTTEELCVFVDRLDPNPPVIQPWQEVLTIDYSYSPDNAVSPPHRGVRIVPTGNANGCVEPFINLNFGVTLNQPARCKITPIRADSYEDMPNTFFDSSRGRSAYNHSTSVRLQSPQAIEAEGGTIRNNGEFDLYVRCENAGGNSNPADFVFSFCIDDGPDTQEPVIESTSIINNSPIGFGQTSVDLGIFVSEPAECRWSRLDRAYEDMETQMSCSTSVTQFNAQGLYPCSTILTGLNDGVNNDYYFRCRDKPHLTGENDSQRITNQQSYLFRLQGTQPLVINSVEPNGTISDSTDTIKVTLEATTSAGHEEGAATCYYEGFGTNGFFNEFINTGTHEHSQDLFLPEGTYSYNIRCTDLGGNSDEATVSFSVETDTEEPVVVRVFRQGQNLKVITDEPANCVYGTSAATACNYLFDDGVAMETLDDISHTVAWNPERNFYIKCQDEFGNQPSPNQCSIIARPFEV